MLHQVDLLYRLEVTVDAHLVVLVSKKLCYDSIHLQINQLTVRILNVGIGDVNVSYVLSALELVNCFVILYFQGSEHEQVLSCLFVV